MIEYLTRMVHHSASGPKRSYGCRMGRTNIQKGLMATSHHEFSSKDGRKMVGSSKRKKFGNS